MCLQEVQLSLVQWSQTGGILSKSGLQKTSIQNAMPLDIIAMICHSASYYSKWRIISEEFTRASNAKYTGRILYCILAVSVFEVYSLSVITTDSTSLPFILCHFCNSTFMKSSCPPFISQHYST